VPRTTPRRSPVGADGAGGHSPPSAPTGDRRGVVRGTARGCLRDR